MALNLLNLPETKRQHGNSFIYFNKFIMGSILYVLAVILIIGWLVGFFAFHAGGVIHILLVIAVIAIVVRLIQGRSV
jgi:predicted lipid-binding transport protein (Tim44 family)